MAGVFTDDADDIFAPHDFAAFAKAFDGGSNFHETGLVWKIGKWQLILYSGGFQEWEKGQGAGGFRKNRESCLNLS